MRVIGIGDNVVDDYTDVRTMFPGGNALNFSVYASMLGCKSAYLGIFGNDEAGRHVQETLDELGIDSSRCRRVDGPNGRAELTHENGERIFLGSNKGGISQSVPMDFIFEDSGYLQRFSLAHTSAYSYLDEYLPRLRALGLPLSYDFSDDFDTDQALSLCRNVDFGFFSCADRSERETQTLLKQSAREGCQLAAATLGPSGAILFDGESWYRQAPHPVTPTDTLGAGDAFICGFLVSLFRHRAGTSGWPAARIQDALYQAAAFAAEICGVRGAFGRGLRY